MPFLPRELLEAHSFAELGENVCISDKASLHNCENIHIGSNVRIDDFCVLSAGVNGIYIGDHVHIAVFCSLIGKGKIKLGNYTNLSSRVGLYSSNDDYSGEYMTNPTVPAEFTNVEHADVIIDKHVIIGSGSIVLPGTHLAEGVAIAALSIVKHDCKPFGVYAGTPVRLIRERSDKLLDLEEELIHRIS